MIELSTYHSLFEEEKTLAVQDFALDATGTQRIQVHWEAGTEPATVLLNNSIIGRLSTDERVTGKDFVLPDGSTLRVQLANNQPYAYRNGYPLPPVASAAVQIEQAEQEQARRAKRGGCLTAWLILNLVANVTLAGIYLLTFLGASAAGPASTDIPSVYFLIFGLFGLVDVAGAILLLLWKKLGFYLIVGAVVASIVVSFPAGLYKTNIVSIFAPLVGVAILYYLMNRIDMWRYLS